jgi:hypothetical protein
MSCQAWRHHHRSPVSSDQTCQFSKRVWAAATNSSRRKILLSYSLPISLKAGPVPSSICARPHTSATRIDLYHKATSTRLEIVRTGRVQRCRGRSTRTWYCCPRHGHILRGRTYSAGRGGGYWGKQMAQIQEPVELPLRYPFALQVDRYQASARYSDVWPAWSR